jgi:hypothetical protein
LNGAVAVGDILRRATSALLGISAYERPSGDFTGGHVSEAIVDRLRRSLGGQLQPLPQSITRWYMSDLETAELAADNGDLSWAAKIMRSARKDGVLAGVLSTRTGGLVRLPKSFRGPADQIAALELGHDNVRSAFDEMFPPAELALLAADGELLGVGVAELVPVEGRPHPVLVRLDPAFLQYRWSENRWYFISVGGPIPITPGDGRWILHVPGGRMTPWQHGLWRCIGRAFVRKEHAALHKDNWEAKLANPARVAISPQGAGEAQKQGHFENVLRWGINTVFGLTPGYDIKLIESNGRGYDSFCKTIADQNSEMIIAVAGQTVTTDGGAGFQNSDIHKSIRADLIKATADGLAFTINTQGIPPWVLDTFGESALDECAVVEWDVTPPKDRNAGAQSLLTAAQAITQLTEALAAHGVQLDIAKVCQQFGVPVEGDQNGDGQADIKVALVEPQPANIEREAA